MRDQETVENPDIERIVAEVIRIYGNLKKERADFAEQKQPSPRKWLSSPLHLFVDPNECAAIVGDLEEKWRITRQEEGRLPAAHWYVKQVILSLGPLAWAWLKRTAGLDALVELFRKIGS